MTQEWPLSFTQSGEGKVPTANSMGLGPAKPKPELALAPTCTLYTYLGLLSPAGEGHTTAAVGIPEGHVFNLCWALHFAPLTLT